MTKGMLDGAVVQFSDTQWKEDESSRGKDIVNLQTVFLDIDGTEYLKKFYMGDQRFTRVDGGIIKSVDQSRDCTISADFAAGKLLASIEDAAGADEVAKSERLRVFKILDDIEDASGLDGLWVKLKSVAGTGKPKDDGTPFTDLLVDELVDAPDGKSAGKKTSGKTAAGTATTASGKKKAAAVDDDDDDDDEASADDDTEEGTEDPIHAAAVQAMDAILTSLATKTPLVKNFDEDAAGGGITIKQAYTASFGILKGKDIKGPASNLINDASFHTENAAEQLYKFSKKTGVITPND
jgi:hypothetical protein